jgi:hypothetical protein
VDAGLKDLADRPRQQVFRRGHRDQLVGVNAGGLGSILRICFGP